MVAARLGGKNPPGAHERVCSLSAKSFNCVIASGRGRWNPSLSLFLGENALESRCSKLGLRTGAASASRAPAAEATPVVLGGAIEPFATSFADSVADFATAADVAASESLWGSPCLGGGRAPPVPTPLAVSVAPGVSAFGSASPFSPSLFLPLHDSRVERRCMKLGGLL